MQIKKITIGLLLFGNPLFFSYLAYVKKNNINNIIFPIGKKIQYTIKSNSNIVYHLLPTIIYDKNHNIRTLNDPLIKDLFRFFSEQIKLFCIDPNYNNGVKIEYINQTDIINKDDRVVSLINGKPPKQDQLRVLIDIFDQLYDHNPRTDIVITFYIKSMNKAFYIEQVTTFMQYKYDNNYIYFFNNHVGHFKYNILTGEIAFNLMKSFQNRLLNQFNLNYPHIDSNINIYVLVLQPNLNFNSIIGN